MRPGAAYTAGNTRDDPDSAQYLPEVVTVDG